MDLQTLQSKARAVRRDIITMTSKAGAGHPGGSLSCTDALVALYFDVMNGHPDIKKCPGVDASTGSLGQGISIAVRMALGAKHTGNPCHVYTVIGDGESQEGLVWEASMAAAHYKLDNLTVILDHNGLQIDGSNDEVMSLGDIKAKAVAFGYDVIEVADGNDMQQVLDALHAPACPGKPRYILLQTLKGKGVSFMEGQVGWHGKAPNAEQAAEALKELEG